MSKYFNEKGQEDSQLNDETAFCKQSDSGQVCFVRRINLGVDMGRFLKPEDMIGRKSFNQVTANREFTSYQKVSPENFRFYLEFLRTGNKRKLKEAERL